MQQRRRWYQNLSDRPFGAALALLLISAGLTAIFHLGLATDALARLVPDWLLTALSISYSLAGLALAIGMAFRRSDVEAFGCVLAASGILVRAVALFTALGLHPATASAAVFYAVFLWAVVARLRQILRREQIVRVGTVLQLKEGP